MQNFFGTSKETGFLLWTEFRKFQIFIDEERRVAIVTEERFEKREFNMEQAVVSADVINPMEDCFDRC